MSNLELQKLSQQLKGELFYDGMMRRLYATDASAYKEMPLAVAIPKDKEDIRILIHFANERKVALIPRTAGTSLAGQVVGHGIVVDVSKHLTKILEVDQKNKTVTVEPGVIRDELNMHLKPMHLFFGPETSTANRAMIGGMIGNNSCGSNSVVYGSTREHLIEVEAFLSDGSLVTFKPLNEEALKEKINGVGVVSKLEQTIYRRFYDTFSEKSVQKNIKEHFPKPSIERRNTGYAVDMMIRQQPFDPNGEEFNFCALLAGSEGTLAFITKAKLAVLDSPPKHSALVCAHFNSIYESLQGNLVALKFHPHASELMDHFILERTKENLAQKENRFFVQGDPQAVLAIELKNKDASELEKNIEDLIHALRKKGLGYHYPVVRGTDCKKVWALRKAGLGLLSNIPGDAKPAPVIEDTAVDVEDLPEYIKEFNQILEQYDLSCVHYAHAGSGEIHLRPVLNLKTEEGNRMFRVIAEEIAGLVKKYKGSLSGEHGDGRLRGEFIPFMIGQDNYTLIQSVKSFWDPNNIFNPKKIVDTPSMNTGLRFEPNHRTPDVKTVFDFSDTQGFVRAAELCNGSGDCRKTHLSGGTMCPSYMATKNEKDTTRARANIIREIINNDAPGTQFENEELKNILDLCLSCKACKSECPSNVDMAKLKAETMHQYYQKNGVPFRAKMVAGFTKMSKMASLVPGLFNFAVRNPLIGKWIKHVNGFAQERSIPTLHKTTLLAWYKKNQNNNFGCKEKSKTKKVYLFCDEFTNYNDTQIGIKAIQLLTKMGIEVIIPEHLESGRTFLSKSLLDKARSIAHTNVQALSGLISDKTPLIGLEPSAILTFRDEYPALLRGEGQQKAMDLKENVKTIEEYLCDLLEEGFLTKEWFVTDKKVVKVHGHCHQKALSSMVPSKKVLSLPENYEVQMIPSGCCGMAGSFGYEKEHYEVSMQVGELVLFPTIRNQPESVVVAASGTSCRHQIKDGTGKQSQHPVEILLEAFKE